MQRAVQSPRLSTLGAGGAVSPLQALGIFFLPFTIFLFYFSLSLSLSPCRHRRRAFQTVLRGVPFSATALVQGEPTAWGPTERCVETPTSNTSWMAFRKQWKL